MSLVEIIVSRYPDAADEIEVFIDGRKATDEECRTYYLDGGAGVEWQDWCWSRDYDLSQASSDEVRQALERVYSSPPGYKYIEGKPESAGWLDPFEACRDCREPLAVSAGEGFDGRCASCASAAVRNQDPKEGS